MDTPAYAIILSTLAGVLRISYQLGQTLQRVTELERRVTRIENESDN